MTRKIRHQFRSLKLNNYKNRTKVGSQVHSFPNRSVQIPEMFIHKTLLCHSNSHIRIDFVPIFFLGDSLYCIFSTFHTTLQRLCIYTHESKHLNGPNLCLCVCNLTYTIDSVFHSLSIQYMLILCTRYSHSFWITLVANWDSCSILAQFKFIVADRNSSTQ